MNRETPAPSMATPIPPGLAIPDTLQTRLGTLAFRDGFPDEETARKVYDHLDFHRAVQAMLVAMPAASMAAMRRALASFGPSNQTVLVFESLMDSRSLFLTPNTEVVYAMAWIDLTKGPVVLESPPNTLGLVDDAWFHYVADLGNAGPDRGQGGKYLFLPPGHQGAVPEGYHVFTSPTYGNWFATRAFLVAGDPKPGAKSLESRLRIYPLDRAANPPPTRFLDVSGTPMNTIHAMDFSFFEEIHATVQAEPNAAMDPETLGLLAALGIEKGKPFAPDARMRALLTEAAQVADATARTLMYRSREKESYFYEGSAWQTPFIGGSHRFERDGVRLLDARTFFFMYATGVTPAMTMKMVGAGSQYAVAFLDAKGRRLDGGKSYRLRLPAGIPAKDFWSVVVYDTQTRSMLQTDEPRPSLNSLEKGVVVNPDASVDVYFGPKAPPGKEANWVQTVPGKGWTVILRLYGPLPPWFDKTWRPGEVEEVS